MELVYLWVEDYKNIHQQGFNFSGRYRCDYDQTENELTITNNKEYVHIFPDNINITAIVGKNGAGKSSVLKNILSSLLIKHQFENMAHERDKQNFSKKPILLLVKMQNGDFKCFSNIPKIISKHNIDFIESNFGDKPFYTMYLNFMPEILNNGDHERWTDGLYHRNDQYSLPILVTPNKKSIKFSHMSEMQLENMDYAIDISKSYYLTKHRLALLHFYEQDKLSQINRLEHNFFRANKISLSCNISKVDEYFEGKALYSDTYGSIIEESKSEDQYTIQTIKYINLLYIIKKSHRYRKEERFKTFWTSYQTDPILLDHFLSLIDNIVPIEHENIDFSHVKLENAIKFHHLLKSTNANDLYDVTQLLNALNSSKETIDIANFSKEFLQTIPGWIDIEPYDNKKGFGSLSFGEKHLLMVLTEVTYHINNIINANGHNYKNFLIILEETELGLHPDWQKRYLKYILELLAFYYSDDNINFHLLFATHSPFLLSDIPSQNTLFLDRDENGNCKVVDGLKDKKQTFGANIHTLLSDAFFMEDGLMGEFAKSKINKAIELLNKNGKLSKVSLDYCENIISIIGEPILKRQLQKMLDSKRLFKIDEIDRLTADMAELHKKLKKLEGLK